MEKNISLSKLVGQLKTNNKYLSYIINSHKNTDFNTYINTLRILYIVDKLKNNPKYLEYKIAYLAKESGFTTHSLFSAVFKEITGESPSEFIKKQQDETYLK
ncbi:MAG TPA: helix-turn-helix domain-containing protein [Chitinophagaceae bacterium]|nr:helix-turn-helix domain-containing protein [Chitinophagaceae bacterium]